VAITARDLLNTSDLGVSLPKVAQRIGVSTGVDRVHVFLVDGEDGQGKIVQHSLWIVPGLPTPHEFRNPSMPLAEAGLGAWIPRLARGETIVGHTRDFDPSARALFESGAVKSVLSVPVFAEGKWHGLIGFDDCRTERDWSAVEIDTIKMLAELGGGAVARASHLRRLADANRIVERSPTLLYRLSPDPPFDITYLSENVSRYGTRQKNCLPPQAAPSRWTDLVAPNDLPRMLGTITLLIEGKSDRVRIDFRLKKRDGDMVWFDSEGYALRDKTGKLTGVEGILADVTDRKIAENKLSFSNILLTTAKESSPDASLIVGANGRIIKFNQNFATLWGTPPQLLAEGLDESALNWVAAQAKDKDAFLARVRYLYNHPDVQSHDEVEFADGRIVDRHSGSLYDPQGKYLGRVWFFRDITEKRRAADKDRRHGAHGFGHRPAQPRHVPRPASA
jgi:PAS domain S-box-containing protein